MLSWKSAIVQNAHEYAIDGTNNFWESGSTILHEWGHSRGLDHTFHCDNACDDIAFDVNAECNGQCFDHNGPTGGQCWQQSQDNRLMASGPGVNLSLCELGIVYGDAFMRQAAASGGPISCGGASSSADIHYNAGGTVVLERRPTWSGDVFISNGTTLELECGANIANDIKIVVGSGSKLKVNGGSISLLCPAIGTWKGIEVYSGLFFEPHGELELSGVKIEDAEIGVLTNTQHNYGFPGGPQYQIMTGGAPLDVKYTDFIRCGTGISFGPYSSYYLGFQQTSTLRRANFIDCEVGIDLDRNVGVQIDLGTFSCLDYDIRSHESAITATHCDFTGGVLCTGVVPMFTGNTYRENDFYECELILEQGLMSEPTVIENNRFFCSGGGSGALLFGDNTAEFIGNQFLGCYEGIYCESTGGLNADNVIRGNYFDYNDYATTASYNNDYSYTQNCFLDSWINDLDLANATIRPFQGDAQQSAGNCFSEFSQVPGKAINGSTDGTFSFVYYSKDAAADLANCKNPGKASAGQYSIETSAIEVDAVCDDLSLSYWIDRRFLYCDPVTYDKGEVKEMIELLRRKIAQLENQFSLTSIQRWYLMRYRRCLDLWARRTATHWVKHDSIDYAIALLDTMPEFRYRALAYGALVSRYDYQAASLYLDNLAIETDEQSAFVVTQKIYLKHLMSQYEDVTSNSDAYTLQASANGREIYSSLARSAYSHLYDDPTRLSTRHSVPVEGRSEQKPSIDNADQVTVFPNPVTNDVVTINSSRKQVYHVSLYDIAGYPIVEKEIRGTGQMSMTDLASGVYIVKVCSSSSRLITTELIVKL